MPANWWSEAWELDLGDARGPGYEYQGVVRRDFERGVVLVRPLGSPPGPVVTGGRYTALDGTPVVGEVTLAEASGRVLRIGPARGTPGFVRFPGGVPLAPF